VKRRVAALAALFAVAGGAGALPASAVNQALVDSTALPPKLSAFGLFRGNDPRRPNSTLRYDLLTPLFSDYTAKDRFISLPAGQKARVEANGTITFPVGTILVKSFGWPDVNGGRPVETRLLIHRAGGWVALPYVWDADGKDATLKLAGTRLPVTFRDAAGVVQQISYAVPNKNQCKECHQRGDQLVPIGPKAANFLPDPKLNAVQLAASFVNVTKLKPIMPRWDDGKSGSLDQRARAYLDVNCAHCHHPQGSASNSGLFLSYGETNARALGIEKRPVAAGRGSGGRDFAITPGDPDASILIYRLESLDPGIAMPETGRATVHREGAALLRQWIAQMPKSPH
jgi:uncharacterized repeat protein (TIGR03806 family)